MLSIGQEIEYEINKLEETISECFSSGKLREIGILKNLETRGREIYEKVKSICSEHCDSELYKKAKLLRFLNPFGCVKEFDVFPNYFDESLDLLGHQKKNEEERYYFALHGNPLRYSDLSVTVCELSPFYQQEWHWHEGMKEHTITLNEKYAFDLECEYFAKSFERISIEKNAPHTLKSLETFSPDFTVKNSEMRLKKTYKGKESKSSGIKIFAPEIVEENSLTRFRYVYRLEDDKDKVEVNITILPPGNVEICSEDFSVVHVFPWMYGNYSSSMRKQKHSIYGRVENSYEKKEFYGGDVIVLRKGLFRISNLSDREIQLLEVKKLE